MNRDGKSDRREARSQDPEDGNLSQDEDMQEGTEKKKKKPEIEVKSVIFVPQTANSQLAKMLREEEKTLEKITGYRIKYVERAGANLGSLLCKSDQWAGEICGRAACLLCHTK